MRAKTVNENTNFERGQDPKEVMGIGRLYNIDFYYADHPSIEGSYVANFIDDLESAIYDIDPKAKYEIRIDDGFADGHVNFKGSKLDGEEMLDMLKAKKEAAMSHYGALASWDFGEVSEGTDESGTPFDPDDDEYAPTCVNCGEKLNGDYCPDCDG